MLIELLWLKGACLIGVSHYVHYICIGCDIYFNQALPALALGLPQYSMHSLKEVNLFSSSFLSVGGHPPHSFFMHSPFSKVQPS